MQIFYCLFVYFNSQEKDNQFFNLQYPYLSVVFARMVECIYICSGRINFRLTKFILDIIGKLATLGCFMQYEIFLM